MKKLKKNINLNKLIALKYFRKRPIKDFSKHRKNITVCVDPVFLVIMRFPLKKKARLVFLFKKKKNHF